MSRFAGGEVTHSDEQGDVVDGQADVDVQLPYECRGDGQRPVGVERSGDVPVGLVGDLDAVTVQRGDDVGGGVQVGDQRSRRGVRFWPGAAAGSHRGFGGVQRHADGRAGHPEPGTDLPHGHPGRVQLHGLGLQHIRRVRRPRGEGAGASGQPRFRNPPPQVFIADTEMRCRLGNRHARSAVHLRQRGIGHRGAGAAVTDTALAEVYRRPGMTIAKAAAHFGVSDEYLRRRIAEAGLTRRPGTFAPRSAYPPDVLQAKAVKLYATGMTMREVGARLGVSSSTVSMALHAAKAPVRPSGGARPEAHDTPRTLITDLYANPDVVAALRRHHVQVPDEAEWHVTGPFHSYVPLPVPAAFVRELYVDIGLSIHHIALLIGLGDFATRNRLIQAGVTFRPSQERCPWNHRRYTD